MWTALKSSVPGNAFSQGYLCSVLLRSGCNWFVMPAQDVWLLLCTIIILCIFIEPQSQGLWQVRILGWHIDLHLLDQKYISTLSQLYIMDMCCGQGHTSKSSKLSIIPSVFSFAFNVSVVFWSLMICSLPWFHWYQTPISMFFRS